MNLLTRACAIALAVLAPAAASAQSVGSSVQFPAGWAPGTSICVKQADGTCAPVSTTNPLPVTGGTGGGGGGSTITAPVGTSSTTAVPVQSVTGAALALDSTANALFKAGQSIGNTAFGISGTLPAFAVTPTVNLGTLNGAATATLQSSMITALGSPYQAGGALPLPSGAATSAKQDTLLAALGTPLQSGGTVDTVIKATSTDRGGVFGTTSATLMASNTARRGYSVQVQGSTGSCYINGIAGATADYHSLQIPAGTYYETPPTHTGTGAVSIICTAASTSVFSREW